MLCATVMSCIAEAAVERLPEVDVGSASRVIQVGGVVEVEGGSTLEDEVASVQGVTEESQDDAKDDGVV